MKQATNRVLLLTLATTVVLSGCATTGGVAGSGEKKCNPWATGAIGAVLGAAIGATQDSDAAAKGAIAGAALGASNPRVRGSNS